MTEEAKGIVNGQISIKVDELRERRLFLATPMYGGMCAGLYCRSVADLAAMCNQYGVLLSFYVLMNESLITRARAYCVDEFMRSDCTHLLFIDSDIGFKAQDVLAMLALSGDDDEYDVLAAPYPKKTIAWEKIKKAVDKGFADKDFSVLDRFVGDFVFNPKPGTSSFRIDLPVEVLEAGTGFMMIKRKTIEKFHEAYAKDYLFRPDHIRTDAFDGTREILMAFQAEIDKYDPRRDYEAALNKIKEQPEKAAEIITEVQALVETESKKRSKRYLSEDYNFSQMCQRIGLKIWLCPWMELQHVGTFVFGGRLQDLAAIGASVTADAAELGKVRRA